MSGCDEWSLFKAFEVLLCISCLLFKWWTDYEASLLFYLFEKQSKEWPLLNNVTWNQSGSWFADVTFGAFTIICIALFVAHLIGELKTTRKTEAFLLGIGSLLFFGVGMMVLSSFDSVPDELFDNSLILGTLALFTGFIFLVDIGCLRNRSGNNGVAKTARDHRVVKRDVTEKEKDPSPPSKPPTSESTKPAAVMDELRSSIKKKSTKESSPQQPPVVENQVQTRSNVQFARNYSGRNSKHVELENYNDYTYDENYVRKYDEKRFEQSQDDSPVRMTDSQVQTAQGKVNDKRDAGTSTHDTDDVTDSSVLQSPKISSTDAHRSGSQTPEEHYQIHESSVSYLLSEKARKIMPTLSPSRIERLPPPPPPSQNNNHFNRNHQCTRSFNTKNPPSTPQDPGYVLHTASKWPRTSPIAALEASESYRKSTTIKANNLGTIHSEV